VLYVACLVGLRDGQVLLFAVANFTLAVFEFHMSPDKFEVANHHVPEASHRENIPTVPSSLQNPAVAIQKPKHDRLLTLAAFGLTLAIMALVIKKFLKINGLGGFIEGKF